MPRLEMAVSVAAPLTSEFKKKITVAAPIETVRDEARVMIEAAVNGVVLESDMAPTDFIINEKTSSVVVRVSGDARFVRSFVDFAKRQPGWKEQGRVYISEIVRVRPLERRTEDPAPAIESGKDDWNILNRHSRGTIRNTESPTRPGIITEISNRYKAPTETVARVSASRRARAKGINIRTLLHGKVPGGSEYTGDAAHIAARLFTERLAAEDEATVGGGRRRRRTLKRSNLFSRHR